MARSASRRSMLAAGATGLAAGAFAALIHPRTAAADGKSGGGDTIALTHVTVIDATGSRPQPNMTVLVRGERIVALGRYGDVPIPRGAQVVNLTGKFLIPGLCDMHVHSAGLEAVDPPLYLANGVTTVREMSGSPLLHEWRDRVEDGTLLGPRSVIASPLVDGSPSLWTGLGAPYIEVGTEAEARQAVRRVKQDGADFVKVYTRLSRANYHAIADEARRQGIPVAGHCPDTVPITEASDAGQRSFEHLFWTWFATSSREAEIRRALADIAIEPGGYNSWFHQITPIEWTAAHSYDARKAATVFGRLAANRSRQVPTLVMHHVLDRPEDVPPADDRLKTDDRLKYVPAPVLEQWQWALEELYKAGRTPQEIEQRRELFGHRLRLVGEMRRAGVPVLAGTDTGTPYCFPGFGLHDELALLVRAGLTPMQALQAATIEPARYLGVHESVGTVSRHKIADLVVLDANPLDDIRHTQRIHAVLVRGRLITAQHRARMLADVAAAAKATPDFPPTAGCACTSGPPPASR